MRRGGAQTIMECVKPFLLIQGIKRYMLPCGKCLVCLQSKRNDWAFRLSQEHKASKHGALFVTLTYNDKNIPDYGSLQKRDLQLFFKRLRNKSQDKIRYYAVGEYGSKSLRPHYHAIIFNTNEADIRKTWELGHVHIGTVTTASVAYVLKYIVQPEVAPQKKIYDAYTEEWKEAYQKPFAVMSRAYGIGAAYLTDEMVSWHRSGGKNYALVPGTNTKIRLPRYYKECIWPKRYLPYKKTADKQYVTKCSDGLMLNARIPLETIEYTERERVFSASARQGRQAVRKERQWFWKTYGKQGMEKYKEHRNALLSRIKLKVAFTQTI